MITIHSQDSLYDIEDKISEGLNNYYTQEEIDIDLKETLHYKEIKKNKNNLFLGKRNWKFVKIEEIDALTERWKKCNCSCPECWAPLKAKLWLIQIHHFSHIWETNCNYQWESSMHLLAKELIKQKKTLFIEYIYKNINIINKWEMVFDEVISEQSNNKKGLVFDIVWKKNNKEDIVIEIANTHFKSDSDIIKMDKQNITCIEIDISNIETEEELIQLLFTSEWSDNKKFISLSKIFKNKQNEIDRKELNTIKEKINSKNDIKNNRYTPSYNRITYDEKHVRWILSSNSISYIQLVNNIYISS